MEKSYKDGEECSHKYCANHITHPCEGCGRIGARSIKLIGFTGPAGCGKSLAANTLAMLSRGEVLSFAAPMKKCLAELFGFTGRQLYTLEGKESIDPRYGVSPRLIMQRFGTEFVRTTVPELWCILMSDQIKKVEFDVFIDDIRFDDEAALVRRLGGTIVHITDRNLTKSTHKSERGVLFYPNNDRIIRNSGTREEFLSEVAKLL